MAPLKDIVPAATNTVNTRFIVLKKVTQSEMAKGLHAYLSLQMRPPQFTFKCWAASVMLLFLETVQLTNRIFSYHKSNLVLRTGKKGRAEKIGEFTMVFVESPNMSEIQWSRDPKNPRKFVKEEGVVPDHSRISTPLP